MKDRVLNSSLNQGTVLINIRIKIRSVFADASYFYAWKEADNEKIHLNKEHEPTGMAAVDIYALPEGTRAELIDGKIYYMAPPNRQHQRIVLAVSRKIADYIDSRKGSCEVYIAPFAVFLNKDDTNYVEPDICVVCDKDKLDHKGCHGAPDLVVEVVSPGSNGRRMDYIIKLFKYQKAGVREYWIVDPIDQTVTVYDLEHDDIGKYTFSDKVEARIYPELKIDFSTLNID